MKETIKSSSILTISSSSDISSSCLSQCSFSTFTCHNFNNVIMKLTSLTQTYKQEWWERRKERETDKNKPLQDRPHAKPFRRAAGLMLGDLLSTTLFMQVSCNVDKHFWSNTNRQASDV